MLNWNENNITKFEVYTLKIKNILHKTLYYLEITIDSDRPLDKGEYRKSIESVKRDAEKWVREKKLELNEMRKEQKI